MSAHREEPLLIRADAGVRIGTGHVMRCLALAQAWQDAGGAATFVMAGEPSPLANRLVAEGCAVEYLAVEPGSAEDARQTAERAAGLSAAWLVVDGYQFSGDYQRRLKDAGVRLLAIDDYGHAGHYWADLVLNQNLTADERLYQRREPYTRLLLGTLYALLRREFAPWRDRERPVPAVARRVLVTLGGTDPDNVSGKVIRALRQVAIDGLEAIVVVGENNPHQQELQDAAGAGSAEVRLGRAVGDMASLMAWADVAVAAGGTTSWERAALGLPGLVLVLADNQAAVAASLHEAGTSCNLGPAATVSEGQLAAALEELCRCPEARASMAQRGRELVDGLGPSRVLAWMMPDAVSLRPATEEDCRLVWRWANDPTVRRASFSSEPIPWEDHRRWFADRLRDPNCLFFLAVGPGGVPLGQVRFDLRGREAVLSISLDAGCRGRGLGPAIIARAVRQILESRRADVVVALVRADNPASRAAFLKAGFVEQGPTEVRGIPATRFVWHS